MVLYLPIAMREVNLTEGRFVVYRSSSEILQDWITRPRKRSKSQRSWSNHVSETWRNTANNS